MRPPSTWLVVSRFVVTLVPGPLFTGKRPWKPIVGCPETGRQVVGLRPARFALSGAKVPPVDTALRAAVHASTRLWAGSPAGLPDVARETDTGIVCPAGFPTK